MLKTWKFEENRWSVISFVKGRRTCLSVVVEELGFIRGLGGLEGRFSKCELSWRIGDMDTKMAVGRFGLGYGRLNGSWSMPSPLCIRSGRKYGSSW